MKRHFGSWASRLIRGGTTLNDGEHHVLTLLVSELPPHLREKVERQFESYDLVQREIDKRTLNFYPRRRGVPPSAEMLLKSKAEVAPLVRIRVNVAGQSEALNAVLTAVNGRAFSVSFNRPVPKSVSAVDLSVGKVTQAWLSNFEDVPVLPDTSLERTRD